MNLGQRIIVLVAVLGLGLPQAAHGRSRAKARAGEQEQSEKRETRDDGAVTFPACEDEGEEEAGEGARPAEPSEEAMAAMRVAVSGQQRPISAVRLRGLKTLTEERVWAMLGARPAGEISSEQASAIVAQLSASGLFASVTPTLDVVGDAAVLDISLDEHPVVNRIVIEGLTEVRAEELLEAILDQAPGVKGNDRRRDRGNGDDADDDDDDDDGDDEDSDDDRDRGRRRGRERQRERGRERAKRGCKMPAPPRDLLASASAGKVAPGIVWQGLPVALQRGLEKLHDQGYAMASLDGELSTDGTLTIHADEGRLEALELVGVEPTVEPEVRKILGIKPGDIFLLDDLTQGVRRVQRQLPFLDTVSDGERSRPMPQIAEERLEDGRVRYRTVEGGSKRVRKFQGNVEVRGRTLSWSFDEDNAGSVTLPFSFTDGPPYVGIQGKRATVRFQPNHTDVSWAFEELLHHTPVQGPAPGALLSVGLLDSENRGHLVLDGGLWFNTARPPQRLDYVVGARLRIPWLSVAEIGAQRYSLTDTSDGWRATPLSSYLSSALFNRPDREYFRREGYTGMLTLHLGQRLTVGAEYRNDVHRSMDSAVTSQSLFNRSELPWANPAIDEGRVASLVGRLEYGSEPVLLRDVGGPLRSLERTLLRDDGFDGDHSSGWRSVNTVEAADPRLGSDFRFTRLVSDSSVRMRLGGHSGLRGRLRVAGGVGLPAQKMEALGGWTALRGYDFKELRGDASALVTAEYQWTVFSAFVDVGSVRSAGVWSPAKVGVGAAFNLGELALAAAWRTDDRARGTPEVRLVFQRTY